MMRVFRCRPNLQLAFFSSLDVAVFAKSSSSCGVSGRRLKLAGLVNLLTRFIFVCRCSTFESKNSLHTVITPDTILCNSVCTKEHIAKHRVT